MGVTLAALAVLGAVAAGSWLTSLLEHSLARSTEPGPAARVPFAYERKFPNADRWLYPAAPVIAVLGIALATVVVPFDNHLIGADLQIGVFYFIVVVDFVVLAIALGGWGANASEPLEACYRIVAQLVAYVVPLGLAYIGAIMAARSLSTQAIVEAQSNLWFIVTQPIGFLLYLVTGAMQAYRAPFLEPFAADIRFGVLGAYGGWKAIFWRAALAGLLFVVAAMGAVLFLGGWRGPILPGPAWMLLKTYALMALMVALGSRVKLLSTAQMLALSWKFLTPIGLLNVLMVGALFLLGVGQTP